MERLAMLSGGLDSAVLLHRLATYGRDGLVATYLDLRLPATEREKRSAQTIAERLGVPFYVTEIPEIEFLGRTFAPWEQAYPVPEKQKAGWTDPCETLTNLAVLASRQSVEKIYLGIVRDDLDEFPGLKGYLERLGAFLKPLGVELSMPLAGMSKVEVVRDALRLGVPVDLTWSCVRSSQEPCGECTPCQTRKAALEAVLSGQAVGADAA